LATSDFHAGAFSAEFGDVLSGVYDVKLRAGNNEKFESVFGVGLLGTDLTLEGPFKKGYGGSYLVNYRYSTVSLIQDIGLVDNKAYDRSLGDTYQVILSASYKWNRLRATHEIFLNMDNVTNNKGKISEFYDESKPNSIGYLTQFGIFPNLMYRVYF
jgi:hypothetical protein